MTILILHAGLEEDEEYGTVIRGMIDPESYKYIRLDWYQREQGFSQKHINEIVHGYFTKSVMEDITLGMRGTRVHAKDSTYTLLDKVFCMNGGQRLYAAQWAVKERPDLNPRLGAKVILDTNEKMENEIFCKAGTTQVRIAASVLVRNKKKESAAANILVAMNNVPDFALKNRVAWDQRKSTHELMTGFTFARVVGALHAHKCAALRNSKPYELLAGLDNLHSLIGAENLQANVVRFFDVIDNCWSIRQIAGGRQESPPQLKLFFLLTLAKLFSRYSEFWDGKERIEFRFPGRFTKSLKAFPLAKYLHRADVVDADILFENLRKALRLSPILECDEDMAAE